MTVVIDSGAWLAARAVEVFEGGLSAEVEDAAARLVFDTIGVVLRGGAEPEVRALARAYAHDDPGEVPCLVEETAMSAASAGLVHGIAALRHGLEAGAPSVGGCPAAHVVGAALSAAGLGRRPVTARELLAAVVFGYEIACRLTLASRLRPSVVPDGTTLAVGAAVSAALLGDGARGDIAAAIGTAASLPLAASTLVSGVYTGVARVYAGYGTELGLRAREYHQAGFVTPDGMVDESVGSILGEHRPGTAEGRRRASMESVEVRTFANAAAMNNPSPATDSGAKFSIPWSIAGIAYGHAGVEAFGEDALARPDIREAATRVSVMEEPSFTAELPARRPTEVTVHLRNGTVLQADTDRSAGDPSAPFENRVVEAKFLELSARALGPEEAHRLLDLLQQIDSADSELGTVVDAMLPPR